MTTYQKSKTTHSVFLNQTQRQIIDHLKVRGGALDFADTKTLLTERDMEWDTSKSPQIYFNRVEKAVKVLTRATSFPTWTNAETWHRSVFLSNCCSQLFARSICLNLEDFWKIWTDQFCIFGSCSFYVIKSSLMDLVPMPGHLLGPFCSGYFGLIALSNQWGERGEHFAPSCLEVTVVLHHAKEMSELSYSCGWLNHEYCLHLITLRINAISCEYVPQVLPFK